MQFRDIFSGLARTILHRLRHISPLFTLSAYKFFSMDNEQRTFCVEQFMITNNSREVARRFIKKFGAPVHHTTVLRLYQKFRERGYVCDTPRSGRPKTARTPQTVQNVLKKVCKFPTKSSRRASAECGVSRTTLMRIYKDNGVRLWKPRLVQELSPGDEDRRMAFARKFLELCDSNPFFVDNVIWSDECIVRLNGTNSTKNFVYYDVVNPHLKQQVSMDKRSIMIWAAVSSKGIIGPFIFESSVTSASYLHLLKERFWPVIMNWPDIHDIYFQQDGAPAHYGAPVKNWLNEKFPGRWIGRGGPLQWPPRSPDLTPPDFWLWSVMEDRIYGGKPKTMLELREAIFEAFFHIRSNGSICERVCRSVVQRMKEVLQQGGSHLQHFGH